MNPFMRDFGTSGAGRPKKNLRPFILKAGDRMPSGGEFINTMPHVIKVAHQQYLEKFELPPALQPSYIRRPEVMEQRRAKAISKGFRHPNRRF